MLVAELNGNMCSLQKIKGGTLGFISLSDINRDTKPYKESFDDRYFKSEADALYVVRKEGTKYCVGDFHKVNKWIGKQNG